LSTLRRHYLSIDQHAGRPATRIALAAALAAAACAPAFATEGGRSAYPNGVETLAAGAVPPPGWYGLLYGTHYTADRVNDNDGNDLHVPGFKLTANVVASRLVWVPGVQVLGGDLVVHGIVPVADLQLKVGGTTYSKSGIGDITLGVGIGHHYSPSLHSAIALNVFLPTGGYDRTQPLNIGLNHGAIEPMAALSHIDPKGFNGDIKAGFIFNQRNKDTDYRSGDEFHFDYALGWGLGNGWTVGAGGYVYRQLSADEQGGAALANSKSSAFAIGPLLKYDSGKGWFATAKWQRETGAKNHTQGNALWLKLVFPL
jgi:hypothetical protein